MAAESADQRASKVVRLADRRNGLEPAPRPALERWYCCGCRNLLMLVTLHAGQIEIRCPKCNAMNSRIAS